MRGLIAGFVFAAGFGAAWYWQGLRIGVVRGELSILQAQVAAANQIALAAQNEADNAVRLAQRKADAAASALAIELAKPPDVVERIRRVTVAGVCQPNPADYPVANDKESRDFEAPTSRADTVARAGDYRCVRRDDWHRWRAALESERTALRSGHAAHRELSGVVEALPGVLVTE